MDLLYFAGNNIVGLIALRQFCFLHRFENALAGNQKQFFQYSFLIKSAAVSPFYQYKKNYRAQYLHLKIPKGLYVYSTICCLLLCDPVGVEYSSNRIFYKHWNPSDSISRSSATGACPRHHTRADKHRCIFGGYFAFTSSEALILIFYSYCYHFTPNKKAPLLSKRG